MSGFWISGFWISGASAVAFWINGFWISGLCSSVTSTLAHAGSLPHTLLRYSGCRKSPALLVPPTLILPSTGQALANAIGSVGLAISACAAQSPSKIWMSTVAPILLDTRNTVRAMLERGAMTKFSVRTGSSVARPG